MKKVAVVGGGISGLATAYEIDKRLRAAGGHYELRLFEAEARVGGKIGAARRDGFVCEAGPNGFLDSKPSTLNLCRELGIENQLLRSSDAAARRFIFSRGELHQLPASPPAFFRSRLLSLPARLAAQLVPKGSIAVDGISLTVVEPVGRRFWVALIPETLHATTLHGLRPGAPVHLETDVLAKYVERQLIGGGDQLTGPFEKWGQRPDAE